ncbi:hypothetical protein [Salmonella phage SSBI34]|nr:hypothetical protein [Salmonella phage SSBI34]
MYRAVIILFFATIAGVCSHNLLDHDNYYGAVLVGLLAVVPSMISIYTYPKLVNKWKKKFQSMGS